MSNNEVKAPRPCTLPKEWNGERTFNVYAFTEIEYIYERSDYWTPYCDVCGSIRINVYIKTNASIDPFRPTQWYDKEEDAIKEAQLFSMEAIQAIASAQRPWLKAEGFDFVDSVVDYLVMEETGSIRVAQLQWVEDGKPNFMVDCQYSLGNVVAFKLLDDSQEARDAVAHVEVYKEVVANANVT